MTPRPPAVLLAASYGVQVGYAWNNIFELDKALARAFHAHGLRVCLSFRDLDGPASAVDPGVPFDTFQDHPRRATRGVVAGLRQEIAARDIRYLYTTDQPVLRWDYPWLRAGGIEPAQQRDEFAVRARDDRVLQHRRAGREHADAQAPDMHPGAGRELEVLGEAAVEDDAARGIALVGEAHRVAGHVEALPHRTPLRSGPDASSSPA